MTKISLETQKHPVDRLYRNFEFIEKKKTRIPRVTGMSGDAEGRGGRERFENPADMRVSRIQGTGDRVVTTSKSASSECRTKTDNFF